MKKAAKVTQKISDISATTKSLGPLAETSRDLVKQADLLYKLAGRLIDVCEGEGLNAKESDHWITRDVTKARKTVDAAREGLVDQLKQVRCPTTWSARSTARASAGTCR